MKRIYSILLALPFLLLCGCTQLEGNIGPIFGSWSLTEMTEDGVPIEAAFETVFSFQGTLVRVDGLVDAPYFTITRYGSFEKSEKVLTLTFQEGPTPSGNQMYMVPNWLNFPKDVTVLNFEIRKLSGSHMELALDIDGKKCGYSFEKTW